MGELAPMASLGIAPITAAAELPTGAAPREVSAGGEDWWLGRQRYEREGFPSFDVVVVVPSADLLGDLRRLQAIVLGAALVTIAAALGFAFLVARRLSAPLEALAGESRRLRDLDFGEASAIDTPLRELRELAEAHEQSRKALESFARYVPLEVVRELVAKGEVAQIGGRSEVLTILFTDIAGFTTLSESMEPRALTEHMAEYFGAMIAALHEHGATVDKLVGDAIVAFWGAPERRDDHARRALLGVLACARALERLTPKWREEGKPELPTRFGLATGSVVVGNVGAPTRLAYTVLGDVANLASRLEGANKHYGTTVIAASSTIDAAGPGFVTRRLDSLAVKGKETALEVLEVVGLEGEVPEARVAELRAYERALDAYRDRRFDESIVLLEPLASRDPPSERLLAEARAARDAGPDEAWSAVTKLTSK
jgi:adenylate cyclase